MNEISAGRATTVDASYKQTRWNKTKESEPMNENAAAAIITGQSVKLYDGQGRNICSIPAPHAKSAVASGDAVAITFERGNVKIYDAQGRFKANIAQ